MFGPLEPEQLEKKPGAGAAPKKKSGAEAGFTLVVCGENLILAKLIQ